MLGTISDISHRIPNLTKMKKKNFLVVYTIYTIKVTVVLDFMNITFD